MAGCRPSTPGCRAAGPSKPTGGWVWRPPGWAWPPTRAARPTAPPPASPHASSTPAAGCARLVIRRGVRARPWPNPDEAALDGVLVLRPRQDADRLRRLLAAGPDRGLVIGAGLPGWGVASVCRELDVPVTVAEAGQAPLVAALGGAIGAV